MEDILELPYDDYMEARWARLDESAKTLLNLYKDSTARNYILALWGKQYYGHHARRHEVKLKEVNG